MSLFSTKRAQVGRAARNRHEIEISFRQPKNPDCIEFSFPFHENLNGIDLLCIARNIAKDSRTKAACPPAASPCEQNLVMPRRTWPHACHRPGGTSAAQPRLRTTPPTRMSGCIVQQVIMRATNNVLLDNFKALQACEARIRHAKITESCPPVTWPAAAGNPVTPRQRMQQCLPAKIRHRTAPLRNHFALGEMPRSWR